MKRYRQKHHIHTFVLTKKRTELCICIAAALCLGFIFSTFATGLGRDAGQKIFEKSIDASLHTKKESSKKFSVAIGTDDLLKSAWPVFYADRESMSVFNPQKADMESETSPDPDKIEEAKASSAIKEKSIVSNGLQIQNATNYKKDALSLADSPVSYDAKGAEPKVLIMHTHGCETYSTKGGTGLGDMGSYRSCDTNINVVSVGEFLSSELQKRGVAVIHDKTLCDYPSYNSSYKTAMGLNDWYLEHYPTISFIFDIHRDAIAEDDSAPVKLTCEIDGKKCAQAMIVCGTDAFGLSHPHWKDNLTLALKIQKVMEQKYPGLMRPVNLREERFNMHQTRGSLIFEIGTHANTKEEAMLCAKYLADGICDVIAI